MKLFSPALFIAALFTSIGAAATYIAITPEDAEEKLSSIVSIAEPCLPLRRWMPGRRMERGRT